MIESLAPLAVFDTVLEAHFLMRLVINVASLLVLIRLCYVRRRPDRDFAFSFFLFGLGVFIVTYLLRSVEMQLGFAFGLFAIFSMLRYRTESISIKEMTYLFLVIAVALLSSVGPVSTIELVALNGLICIGTVVAETPLVSPAVVTKRITYERIEHIKPEKRDALLDDLRTRTGLDIHDVEVDSIDFLRDAAVLKVYYRAPD